MKKINELSLDTKLQDSKNPLFEKRTVSELSDSEMAAIDGGTTPACFSISLLITLTLIPYPAY
ncbi:MULTISPECIES: hypothetical protein [Bacteroidota]|uniref:hypothetical protein n=1 Tax=Bacteroidota TaxID=976 RepID=UPI0025C2B8BF|nr:MULTISPECIES: hypothetical protein [Bacteroidota]